MDRYIGRLLDGRYEILEVIGTGGMAYVYKARCHRLNRLVAVKILKEEYSKDADFKRRFYAESQAVAMLSHPNIVAVYDVNRSPELEYIVMELIDGLTLKQYMQKKGTLNWREALHFSTLISKALEHAHSRGIIHRDIKPHNIMVLRDGSVKVADFGIARFTASQNTLTQEALGSVHYISPEQAKGSKIDNRSDIYSLGVVLYEMLTGRLPYESDSPVAVAIAHINSVPVMPREINNEIPIGLEEISMKAMCADIDKRYKSATEMLEDLEEFRVNQSVVFGYFGSKPNRVSPETGSAAENYTEKSVRSAPGAKGAAQAQAAGGPRRSGYNKANSDKSNRAIMITTIATITIFLFGVGYFLWSFLLSDIFSPTEQLLVPSFVGANLNEIVNNPEYSKFDFVVGQRVSSDEYAEDVIISHDPPAERTVRSGARITLTVSSGAQFDIMPNLIKTQYQSAILALEALDVDIIISQPIYDYSDTIVEGYVIRTTPEADTTLSSGDTVTLIVSQGPQVELVEVPALLGTNQTVAISMIEEAGLKKGVISGVVNNLPEGTVTYQSLAAGTMVKGGTTINLQVSLGPDASPSPSPDASPDISPSPDLPAMGSKEIKIELPEGEGEVLLTLKLDDNPVWYEVIDRSDYDGSISRTIEGIGEQILDVYFDAKLAYSTVVDFGS